MAGGGLKIDMPLTLGAVWAVLCTDVLQSLEYRTRPYEIIPGQTNRVAAECVDYLCEAFRRRPQRGSKWRALLWHLTTNYFVDALSLATLAYTGLETASNLAASAFPARSW